MECTRYTELTKDKTAVSDKLFSTEETKFHALEFPAFSLPTELEESG